VCIAKDEDDYI
jgi:hypothetical protein